MRSRVKCRAGADLMAQHLTFVHFSDTHIVRPGVSVRDVDTCETLRRVVDAVNRLDPAPAFVVIGGDLVSPDIAPDVKAGVRTLTTDDYELAYETFQGIVKDLAVPVHFALGNHDRRVPFRRVVLSEPTSIDEPRPYAFEAGDYRVCVLDSLDPGKNPGYLREAQLAWLRAQLRDHPGRPTILVLHHHAVPVGVRWLDEQMLIDADELWSVVREAGNVRAVLCGHVHLRHEAVRDGVAVYTTPSTCFQISKESDERKFFPGPPAFRLVRCDARGVSSDVVPVWAGAGRGVDGLAG